MAAARRGLTPRRVGLTAFVASRHGFVGAIAVVVGAVVAAATASLRVPVPLNQAGARVATVSLVAAVVSVPWSTGLAVECLSPVRTRSSRAGLLAWCLGVLVAVGVLGALLAHGGAVERYAFACGFFLAMGAVLSPLPVGVPRWGPNVLVVMAMLVFGVDREARTPYAWAWLLSDRATVGVEPATVVPVVLTLVGVGVSVLRPVRRAG